VLPKDLVEVRKIKGRIFPKFARDEDLELARKVLKIYKTCINDKYKKIQTALRKIENASNFKKVRGFARIIERDCVFDKGTSLDPKKVRLFLFEHGYVTTVKEREEVIKKAAQYFGVEPSEIENAMFADYEDELVLKSVPELSPIDLVKKYNLSLLQSTVFNCLRLTFWITSNYKNVFRKIKLLGLMYELYEKNERVLIEVTGPASILKMTRKYATSMAKLIPEIIKAKNWWIRAEIVDESKRVYFLEISDVDRNLFPDIIHDDQIEFDSQVEEEFYRRLKTLTGLSITREPGLVKAGNYAYIPDFAIERNGKKIYIEIAGFWTKDYLERKLKKITELKIPIILIIREDLGVDKLKIEGKSNLNIVIMKKGKIPYGEVLRKIKLILGG